MDFLTQTDVLVLAFGALILGMVILVKGGDWTIDGAVEIARYYGMPPLLVGFTIVAFGTSLPELIASINANLKDTPGLAVGNVIGSNIANLMLIGGASAFVAALPANLRAIRNDLLMMLAASIVWMGLLLFLPISPLIGSLSLAALVGYIFLQYNLARRGSISVTPTLSMEEQAEQTAPKSHKKAIIYVVGGLIGLAIGAELLIRGSVTAARILNVPDSIIGLTIVAFGTSLPELTTCVIAAMKKQTDVILGNIVGSNVFNLMMILGSMGLVKSYDITNSERSMILQDGGIMIGVSLLFVITLVSFRKVPKAAGGVFAGLYFAYMILLIVQSL